MSAAAAHGPVGWGRLWSLSWPLVLTMLANAGVGLLDTWVAGQADPTSQAVVALSGQLVFLVGAATTAWSMGCQALVSRAVGAEDWDGAGRVARQTLMLGAGVTTALLAPLYLAAPWLFALVGADPAVQAAGAGYFRWLLLAFVPMDLAILVNAVFRARGRMHALLLSNLADNGGWAAGSLLLGYGLHWGLHGLAAGFVIGRVLGFVVAWSLFTRSRVYRHMPAGEGFHADAFRRIASIGLPAGVQLVVRNLALVTLMGILARLPAPTAAIAAYSIGFRVEAFAFLPVFALNLAVATVVGQALGAGRPEEARRSTWRTAAVGAAVMAAFGLVFWFGAEALAARFSPEAEVRAIASSYLRIAAVSEPALGLLMVLNGALQGAGDTRPPLYFTLGTQLCFRVPVAYLMAIPLRFGADGVAWAMTLSVFVQAGVVVAYFVRGGWQRRTV